MLLTIVPAEPIFTIHSHDEFTISKQFTKLLYHVFHVPRVQAHVQSHSFLALCGFQGYSMWDDFGWSMYNMTHMGFACVCY